VDNVFHLLSNMYNNICTNIKIYTVMNREELKRMWLSLPTSNVVTRTILVETKYNHVTITSDGPNGFRQHKSCQDFPVTYAKDTKEYKSGEYQLVIK